MRAIDGGAYANLELPQRLRRSGLSDRDAAFATELVYGASRMRGFYDRVIARCAGRDLDRIDPPVLDILRLGAHQLLGMRVGAHAAVDQSVALARATAGPGTAGFVNAVLRRIAEKDAAAWRAILLRHVDAQTPDGLAIVHSHPEWVVLAFRDALLGHGAATSETVDDELRALLEADNAAPIVHLVARPGLADPAELLAAGGRPSPVSPVGVRWPGGDPGSLAAVREGRAAVQDDGSQLLPFVLADAPLLESVPVESVPAGSVPAGGTSAGSRQATAGEAAQPRAERWLDLCAGPGGKAALLAALARDRGAVLFANEVSEHRTTLVRQAVRAAVAAGAEVMIGTGDGRTVGAEEPATYDRVLVDAPCTGLGALRRRPEARWRRRPGDLATLGRLQRELLTSAVEATRPGGLIGYATCSPHLAETRYVVDDVLTSREDLQAIDVQPYLRDAGGAPLPGLGHPPYAQLWPHRHGTEGMFFALLRRTDGVSPGGASTGVVSTGAIATGGPGDAS